jgi:hypothetical protein
MGVASRWLCAVPCADGLGEEDRCGKRFLSGWIPRPICRSTGRDECPGSYGDNMKVVKTLVTAVLVTITLIVLFFSTTVVLSFIYGLDEALLTF